jgi:D-arabinose 1-dehydrogenase-like Zn-dependent alcohol dehydrogenase
VPAPGPGEVLPRCRTASTRWPHDTRDTLEFSAAHNILPEITTVGLSEANAALDAMAAGHAGQRSVIVFD